MAPFSLTFMRIPEDVHFLRASFSLRRRSSSSLRSSSDMLGLTFGTSPTLPSRRYAQLNDRGSEEAMMGNALSDKERALMDAYWRAPNHPSGRPIYLYHNPPLKQTLTNDHTKPRPPAPSRPPPLPHFLPPSP